MSKHIKRIRRHYRNVSQKTDEPLKAWKAKARERHYGPTVMRYVDDVLQEVPSELHADLVKRGVGGMMRAWAGAPGCGYVDERITRIDDTGVYTEVVEDTIRELEPWEVV